MPAIPHKQPAGKFNPRMIPHGMCEGLISTHHYSHRMPSAVQLCFGDVDYGPPKVVKACVMFSNATGRWEEPLWELTRLVRLPEYDTPLTKLISKSLGHIRQHRLESLLISFADGEEDHHGGIYQACSWLYAGMRGERLDGFNIDGKFTPARTCNATYGTSSEEGLKAKLPNQVVESHFDLGKHLYWKALTKDGLKKAIRLGLSSKPYPRPMLAADRAENKFMEAGHRGKGVVDMDKVMSDFSKYFKPNKFEDGAEL